MNVRHWCGKDTRHNPHIGCNGFGWDAGPPEGLCARPDPHRPHRSCDGRGAEPVSADDLRIMGEAIDRIRPHVAALLDGFRAIFPDGEPVDGSAPAPPVCTLCGHRHPEGGECATHPWADVCPYNAGPDCTAVQPRVTVPVEVCSCGQPRRPHPRGAGRCSR